jgi:hypothetical protein
MVQTHIKLSHETHVQLQTFCTNTLNRINQSLQKGYAIELHAIDEVVVMCWKTHQEESVTAQELAPVYSFSIDPTRAITMNDLTQVQYELLFDVHFNYAQNNDCQLYEVAGQSGELFDFVVPVIYPKQGYEFFVFGNYLGGAMEDLQKNENWSRVKALFIGMAIEMCECVLLEI